MADMRRADDPAADWHARAVRAEAEVERLQKRERMLMQALRIVADRMPGEERAQLNALLDVAPYAS